LIAAIFLCCLDALELTFAVQEYNGIGDEGAKCIGEALKVNTSLQTLNFVSRF
jgi:hypothetical protein